MKKKSAGLTLIWAGVSLVAGCAADSGSDAELPAASGDGDATYDRDFGGDGDLALGESGDGDGDGDGDGEATDPDNAGGAAGAGNVPEEPPPTNPFTATAHDPLSTFAADVDTASYDLFKYWVQSGSTIQPASIRLEEFVNYFEYDYPAPNEADEHPFSISLAAAPNLSTRDTHVLRVGIQGVTLERDPAETPANLVFLVDKSGSMSGEIPTVQRLLRQTVELLAPTDSISIVTYASSPETALASTPVSESETILAAIDGLQAGGSTNGSGGITAAYDQAESAFVEGGINHILICTDGDFNVGLTSRQAMEDLIVEKRQTGITFTALGFGGGNFNDALMEHVSNLGNGIYSYIGSNEAADTYVEEQMLQSMMHIAKDMKIQVEFNPELVYAYRLLGYENRDIADDDFRNDVIDAGEIGSGHRVTALYELAFQEGDLPDRPGAPPLDDGAAFDGVPEISPNDIVLVKVRYKEPGASESDAASEVSTSLTSEAVFDGFDGAGGDLQYAAAVAAYAEILKGSPYASPDALSAIRLVLEAQAERDAARAELLELFDMQTAP